ncbi:MAG: 3-oxoacyl-[acyl-carrier-protein] synthase III C-terminal domain-containing protein [Planctomycetota bacterium]
MAPDSRSLMGWDVHADEWQVVFSPRIPSVVKREARSLIESVASPAELAHWIFHPGGRKVLEAYAEALHLTAAQLEPATTTLSRCGNMSAATVSFVLDHVLGSPSFQAGPAVATAFGPGFSAEAVALELHRSHASERRSRSTWPTSLSSGSSRSCTPRGQREHCSPAARAE